MRFVFLVCSNDYDNSNSTGIAFGTPQTVPRNVENETCYILNSLGELIFSSKKYMDMSGNFCSDLLGCFQILMQLVRHLGHSQWTD